MIIHGIIAATALSMSPQAAARDEAPVTARIMLADGNVKNPKKWIEMIQPVQNDAEYSPPVGRKAEPEPSATVPVRWLSPEKRLLPVIVEPAPRYVDEAQSASGIQSGGSTGRPTNRPAPVAPLPTTISATPDPTDDGGVSEDAPAAATVLPSTISTGSATGSKAVVDYGTLPG